MLKKELLFCSVSQTYPDLCDGTLTINGDLIVNEDLYINGNLEVNGSVTGNGTVYVSGTATVSGSIGNLKQQAIFRHYDLSCDNGTTTFNGNTTFENNTVSVTNTSGAGIENVAEFTIYCKVEATGSSYGVHNKKTFIVKSTLIATATSSSGYGVYNSATASFPTFIIESGGYVEATGSTYGVYNNNNQSGTFIVEGTLIATATSYYGVYNRGTFTIESGGYVEATGSSSDVYNYSSPAVFTVKGTLIAVSTSNYGIYNRYPSGTFIIESGGYVEATGSTYGVYNSDNTSGTFTVEGTLIATATSSSGYGVYTSSGIFILNGTCYVVVKNTSYAVKGTITGTGTLYVNGVETEF